MIFLDELGQIVHGGWHHEKELLAGGARPRRRSFAEPDVRTLFEQGIPAEEMPAPDDHKSLAPLGQHLLLNNLCEVAISNRQKALEIGMAVDLGPIDRRVAQEHAKTSARRS